MGEAELKLTSPKPESGFRFRVEVDKDRPSVTLYDGSMGFMFVLRNSEPYCNRKPYELTAEKYLAMKKQARPVLNRLEEEKNRKSEEADSQFEIKF